MPTRISSIAMLLSLAIWSQAVGQSPQPVSWAAGPFLGGIQQVSASVESPIAFNTTGVVAIANPVLTDQAAQTNGQENVGVAPEESGDANEQTGGLQPQRSANVLEALTTPNTAYEGVVPESAAAKRAMPPAYLGFDRGWATQMYLWQSSNIFHHPLYFEDAMLERHGHTALPCLQPLVSGTKFFGEMALMPYLMTMHRPCECRYALGHFRPGTCAPAIKDTLPWDRHAAVVQGLAVTGVVVGLPW